MRRRSWSFPFVLAAVLAYAFMATNGTAHGATRPDVKEVRLSRIASDILGRKVTVTTHQFGCPGRVRGCTDMTAGEAFAFEDGSLLIQLAPDVSKAIKDPRRILPWRYPLSSSGDAVFTFAHEIGHLASRNVGEFEEAKADCYGSRTWRRVALRLGFKAAQLPALASQIHGSCWGPTAADL